MALRQQPGLFRIIRFEGWAQWSLTLFLEAGRMAYYPFIILMANHIVHFLETSHEKI